MLNDTQKYLLKVMFNGDLGVITLMCEAGDPKAAILALKNLLKICKNVPIQLNPEEESLLEENEIFGDFQDYLAILKSPGLSKQLSLTSRGTKNKPATDPQIKAWISEQLEFQLSRLYATAPRKLPEILTQLETQLELKTKNPKDRAFAIFQKISQINFPKKPNVQFIKKIQGILPLLIEGYSQYHQSIASKNPKCAYFKFSMALLMDKTSDLLDFEKLEQIAQATKDKKTASFFNKIMAFIVCKEAKDEPAPKKALLKLGVTRENVRKPLGLFPDKLSIFGLALKHGWAKTFNVLVNEFNATPNTEVQLKALKTAFDAVHLKIKN